MLYIFSLFALPAVAPPVRRAVNAAPAVAVASPTLISDEAAFMARKFKYKCEICSLVLEKKKHLEEHERGKKHRAAVERADHFWERYEKSVWYDPAVPRSADVNAFSFNAFLDGLVRRTRMGGVQPVLTAMGDGCVSPHVSLAHLDATKRAMLFRYLDEHARDTHYERVLMRLERDHGSKYTRIKEILESVETYRKMVELVQRPTAPRRTDSSAADKDVTLGGIHDVACGHGLAGLLLAAHYPAVPLTSSDLVRRESYAAHVQAWRDEGVALANARFVQGNFTELYDVAGDAHGDAHGDAPPEAMAPNSLVLCVHGCNDASKAAVELAQQHSAGWAVVPCCMQNGYAPSVESLRLSDEHRYVLLCGAMAATYRASVVWSLEARVTPRSVILAAAPREGTAAETRPR